MFSSKAKITETTSPDGVKFHKLNLQGWEWRDGYHWTLTLTWTQFSVFVFGIYFAINLIFATIYHLRPESIAGMDANSWLTSFFFSVETLATVGYGHMYPATLYGHLAATVEIIFGMFGMAIITGLIFIRFSRPVARIIFSDVMTLAPFNGELALSFRMANVRDQAMAEAEFRLIVTREEPIKEGGDFRRFYPLSLQFDRLILFPAVITIRHIIDERSPLHGLTMADWERADVRFNASLVCIDTVIPAPVQTSRSYTWRHVRENQRFVEVYQSAGPNALLVDYSLIHDVEPMAKR